MSKDARNDDLELSAVERDQFDALVALLAQRGFGEEGPPVETTFAQIEQFGHRAGQMVARALDAHLAEQHAEHFEGEQPCPSCGEKCRSKDVPHELSLQTSDGDVPLPEPAYYCPSCRRDFFPSAARVAD